MCLLIDLFHVPQVEYCLSKFRLKTNVEHIVDYDEVSESSVVVGRQAVR